MSNFSNVINDEINNLNEYIIPHKNEAIFKEESENLDTPYTFRANFDINKTPINENNEFQYNFNYPILESQNFNNETNYNKENYLFSTNSNNLNSNLDKLANNLRNQNSEIEEKSSENSKIKQENKILLNTIENLEENCLNFQLENE